MRHNRCRKFYMNAELKANCYRDLFSLFKENSKVTNLTYPEKRKDYNFFCDINGMKLECVLKSNFDLLKIQAERVMSIDSVDKLKEISDKLANDDIGVKSFFVKNKICLQISYPFGGVSDEDAHDTCMSKSKSFLEYLSSIDYDDLLKDINEFDVDAKADINDKVDNIVNEKEKKEDELIFEEVIPDSESNDDYNFDSIDLKSTDFPKENNNIINTAKTIENDCDNKHSSALDLESKTTSLNEEKTDSEKDNCTHNVVKNNIEEKDSYSLSDDFDLDDLNLDFDYESKPEEKSNENDSNNSESILKEKMKELEEREKDISDREITLKKDKESFDSYKNNLVKDLNEKKSQLINMKNDLVSKKSELDNNRIDYKNNLSLFEKEKTSFEKFKEDELNKFEELKKNIEEVSNDNENRAAFLDKREQELNEKEQALDKKEQEFVDAKEKYESDVETLKNDKIQFENQINQSIERGNKASENEIKELKKLLQSSNDKLANAEKIISEKDELLEKSNGDYADNSSEIEELEQSFAMEIESIMDENTRLNILCQKLKNNSGQSKDVVDKLEKMKHIIEELKTVNASLTSEKKNLMNELNEYKTRQITMENRLQKSKFNFTKMMGQSDHIFVTDIEGCNVTVDTENEMIFVKKEFKKPSRYIPVITEFNNQSIRETYSVVNNDIVCKKSIGKDIMLDIEEVVVKINTL